MRTLFFLVLLFSLLSTAQADSQASMSLNSFECECSWQGIWLDVILLIDNSNSMTAPGLAQIKAHIATMVHYMNISDNERDSHFGVISYSHKPTLVRDITQPQSVESVTDSIIDMKYSGSGDLNINEALELASQQLEKSKRRNARKVIIIYGTVLSPKDNPFQTADQLKEAGISIVTVAFLQSSEGSLAKRVGELASPGMNLTSLQPELFERVKEVLCDANCFCPVGWQQFRKDTGGLQSLGQCFMYGNLDANWFSARFACEREGGYLMAAVTNKYLQQVKAYLQEVGEDPSAFYKLHVGLRFQNVYDNYVWEGGFGVLASPFETNWCAGFPNLSRGRAVLSVVSTENDDHCWVNEDQFAVPSRYICQKRSCDAGKFCR